MWSRWCEFSAWRERGFKVLWILITFYEQPVHLKERNGIFRSFFGGTLKDFFFFYVNLFQRVNNF